MAAILNLKSYFNSVVDWDIGTKFCTAVDTDAGLLCGCQWWLSVAAALSSVISKQQDFSAYVFLSLCVSVYTTSVYIKVQ